MDKAKRRDLGAHYTSEQNILKVVRSMFLDELEAEFESLRHDSGKLRRFQEKLIGLRFFDPACGCENFLVITYREMRRLELEVLKQLRALTKTAQGQLYVRRSTSIPSTELSSKSSPRKSPRSRDGSPTTSLTRSVHRVRCGTFSFAAQENATRGECERLEVGLEYGGQQQRE